MAYFCSMIKYLWGLVLAFFVFRFLGRLFDPILSGQKRARSEKKKKKKVGEYIDYEEVEIIDEK